MKRLEASRRAKVLSEGRWWTVAGGKLIRKATVIVLTKQPFNGLNSTIRQKWDKLIDDTNKLIATAEETAQNQLFRVNRMGVNSAVSKYKRRIEIIQARPNIEDEEILQVLSPQLEAILRDEFVRCWVEGDSTVTLVARSILTGPELDNGEKLGKAMKEENPGIKLGFRDLVRLSGQAWGGMAKGAVKATVVKFEVYELSDAAKLVKNGIKIGGKVRIVEEFRGQPKTIPVAPRNAPTGLKNHTIPKSGQCLGCLSYRNGVSAHMTQACLLRNGIGYRN